MFWLQGKCWWGCKGRQNGLGENQKLVKCFKEGETIGYKASVEGLPSPAEKKGTCLPPDTFAEHFSSHCVTELLNHFQQNKRPITTATLGKFKLLLQTSAVCLLLPAYTHISHPAGTPRRSGHICLFVLRLAQPVIQFLRPALVSP